MNDKNKIWAYGTCFAVAMIIFIVAASVWDLFSQTELLQIIRILSDAFFLPGVMFVGVALIGWIGSKGTFDIFSFSMRNLFSMFKKESYYKNASFYEYRRDKDENRKPFNLPMMVVGLAFLALGILFTVVFLILDK